MSFKIVVGINGAQGGADALALAYRLAPPGAELSAVIVAVMDGHPSRGVNLDYDRYVREDTLLHLVDTREQHHDLRGEVLEGSSVAAGLHAAVAALDADLLVIGACRRGLVGRVFSGDDVRQTLRGAPCPVAVAPRDFALAGGPIATVGLGWNGDAEAEHALDFAKILAEGSGATLHALGVLGVQPWPPMDSVTALTEIAAADGRLADRLGTLEVETTTVRGMAADELATFAAEVDVLVVGSHQRGPLGRIEMGSTSESLARRCKRPLVVVPRAPQTTATPA